MMLPELIDLLRKRETGKGGVSVHEVGPGVQKLPGLSPHQQSCMSYAMSMTKNPSKIQKLMAKCERGELEMY